jgi:hypothetical protein
MCKRSSLFALVAVAAGLAGSLSASAQNFGALRGDLTVVQTQKSSTALVNKAPVGSVLTSKVCVIPPRLGVSKRTRTCPMPNNAIVGVVCYCKGIDKEDGVIQNGAPILAPAGY